VALAPGDRIGPYEIQALLGAGGMGEVYRGRDTRLGRDVALKVIAPRLAGEPSFRHRFEREARAASALNHPAIVTIYDVGETDGRSWIAMEWVAGRTLRHALRDGPLAVRDAWAITRQVAEALAVAHAKGIVHRDLKPENVMLGPDGQVKILDFGLARQNVVEALEGSQTAVETTAPPAGATFEGSILGTVGYMSPEQASGRPVDFRSDQFALGLLAYEMLAGRRAFEGPSAVETLSAIIREDPVPIGSLRPDVPDGFGLVIARALAKLPKDRFDSTRELASVLATLDRDTAAATGAPAVVATSAPVAAPGTAETRRRPSRRAVLAGAGLLAVAAAAVAWNLFGSTPQASINSLAVLPFENAGDDADIEYLGDGLTDSLINRMSRVPSLKVMARGTVLRFKGAPDPQAAGEQLSVGAVLTGRVARRGERVTISAELIEVASGLRLWGETYDGPFADVMRMQDSIASNICEGLRLQLSREERRTLAQHGTDNPAAYELYLRGRSLMVHDTEEDDQAALRLFEQAAALDPRFVDARLAVATVYVRSAGNLYVRPATAWARAEKELTKVLALDPDNFSARVSLATRRFLFDWDWSTAEREFQALADDPRLLASVTAYHPVALYSCIRGRPDDAAALVERALQRDPANLESRVMLGDFLMQAGRLDEAVTSYTATAASAPEDARPLFGLADILKRRGDIDGAIHTLRKAYGLAGEDYGLDALASATTEADYEQAEAAVARVRLRDLEALARERYVSPLDLARLHAQLSEREEAFARLEEAFAERSPGLVSLKIDRAWDRVRDDARFAAVVRRVGIP
jgi:serine/threonine-protein kinase